MHSRTLLVILNAGVFILLLVLIMEAAGMRRSLRRIEHEERRLVTHCVAEGVGCGGLIHAYPILRID
ncbi:MAG TPA: hypothetical protein VFE43_00395 [Candidatus Binataceae bacterium]|jgi:hypothetical protein|nr:hypothetical protein [Candidatus Binataceae bacterium]